jgi:glycosyltransferase involved in cell wall biosynthesis
MKRPTVSIITVARNAAATIERTIQSVSAQDYADREYIVIDGASTDGTQEIIDRYSRQIDDYISEPDTGIYDAMNKGVRRARGEWIHLLNADDEYMSAGVWSEVLPRLRTDRTNYMTLVIRSPGGDRLQRFRYRRWPLYYSAYLPHPTLVVHREQYDIGLYDTRYRIAADHDFILRMLRLYPGQHVDIPFAAMHAGGTASANPDLSLREVEEITVRHGLPRPLARAFRWVKARHWKLAQAVA